MDHQSDRARLYEYDGGHVIYFTSLSTSSKRTLVSVASAVESVTKTLGDVPVLEGKVPLEVVRRTGRRSDRYLSALLRFSTGLYFASLNPVITHVT